MSVYVCICLSVYIYLFMSMCKSTYIQVIQVTRTLQKEKIVVRNTGYPSSAQALSEVFTMKTMNVLKTVFKKENLIQELSYGNYSTQTILHVKSVLDASHLDVFLYCRRLLMTRGCSR